MIAALCLLLLQTRTDADKAIAAYEKAVKSAKDTSGRAAAVGNLGGVLHPDLRDRLIDLAANPAPEIRAAAVNLLGGYRNDEKAADAIDRLIADRDTTVAVRACQALGELEHGLARKRVEKLNKRFLDKDEAVAKASVEAAGVVRAKESIDPLIDAGKLVAQKLAGIFQQMGIEGCNGG